MTIPETQDSVIADHLVEVQGRVQAACQRSARVPSQITLIAVTKFFPAETIRKACALGLAHIGENRVQELIDKFEDGCLKREFPHTVVHLIGHLQSNKVRKALQFAASIDSVDSPDLAVRINHEAMQAQRRVRVLVEVNTSGEPQKFGIMPDQTIGLIEQMLPLDHLEVAGLMTIGPNVLDEEAIRKSFQDLRTLFEQVGNRLNPPNWKVLSMGMSGDYEIAIEEGATEIRLGTALFGPRRSN
jgi:PLP dependent protein